LQKTIVFLLFLLLSLKHGRGRREEGPEPNRPGAAHGARRARGRRRPPGAGRGAATGGREKREREALHGQENRETKKP
jgi:hypothetical protein